METESELETESGLELKTESELEPEPQLVRKQATKITIAVITINLLPLTNFIHQAICAIV